MIQKLYFTLERTKLIFFLNKIPIHFPIFDNTIDNFSVYILGCKQYMITLTAVIIAKNKNSNGWQILCFLQVFEIMSVKQSVRH